MKGNLDAWSGMVGVDWGGLRSLAEWGWSTCNNGGTVLKSGDLALGMDHDNNHSSFIEEFLEDAIHHHLECHWAVSETKEHVKLPVVLDKM